MRPADNDQAERLHIFVHDIKNRLTGLWEAMRMLRDAPDAAIEKDEILAFAEKSFLSAQRDVEELLDAFAVDRGIKAGKVPFDLVAALNDAVKAEGFRFQKKEQAIHVQGPDQISVVGDAHWATCILQALLSNASKFSSRGGTIDVALRALGGSCCISVTDHGRGLSTEDLEQVFTRYALLSSRSTAGEPQARGTLARARQWAEAQGGMLSVVSPGEGAGCTFTFTLPLAG